MSQSNPGGTKTLPRSLLASFFSAIVDAAHGDRFDPKPVAEMFRLIAIISAIIGIGGISLNGWHGLPIHNTMVFFGFLAIGLISLFAASVVLDDD